jgi:NDP-sugar pyrophosphorylase family protein
MQVFKHAVILAAGRGVRMMPLTKRIPKALVKVKDETLILGGIKKVKKFIQNIHITVGYKGSAIAQHVIKNNVSSVINTNGKGNAWWIFNFPFNLMDEPIVVLTCDNITSVNFKFIEKDYLRQKCPPCMLVPVKPVEGLDGDFIHKQNDKVNSLSRKENSDIYCSGIQIINPKKINQLIKKTEDFNILWKRLMVQKKLHVSRVVPKKWFTIDSVNQLNLFKKNL